MNVVCVGYRNWALKIYNALSQTHNDKNFIVMNHTPSLDLLSTINPNLILWYGWSDIIPTEYLNSYYSVMLHPSPLPKYRGGSPIQNQIINGETISAVTLFKMDQGIDTGDIIEQEYFNLDGDLNDILSKITNIGISLTNNLLSNYPNITLTPQNNKKSTYYKRRNPNQSEITLKEIRDSLAKDLYNKIRALQDPYPNVFIKCKNGTKLYLTKSHL